MTMRPEIEAAVEGSENFFTPAWVVALPSAGAHAKDNRKHRNFGHSSVLRSIEEAMVVEDYPNYPKVACILMFQKDKLGSKSRNGAGYRTQAS